MRHLKIPNYKYYLLLILFTLVVYWPLSLTIYTLKNDALTYFLPFRYHVSEAVQHGNFPFWSPYLYTGLPLHADIQSGAWNPVVLFLSLFTRYNMSVLQWETLLYIIIGGVGFFKLSRFFNFEKTACFILATSYTCSGFIIDSASFIPWITSAAWLPFTILYFLKILYNPTTENSIKLSFSYSLLFLAGYPSFFIFISYILLFISFFRLVLFFRNKQKQRSLLLLKHLSLTGAITMAICAPALISYVDFFSYYARGSGIKLAAAQMNSFTWQNTMSYLFPPASYRLESENDISSRNAFVGLVPLLFLIYSFRTKFNLYQKTIALLTTISLAFSLGDATPIRAIFFHTLPLMDSFRHPGTIRLFTSIGLLLLAGFGINKYLIQPHEKFIKKIILVFCILIFSSIVYSLLFTDSAKHLIALFQSFEFDSQSVKSYLDNFPLSTWLVLSALIQLSFLIPFYFSIKRKATVAAIASVNLFIITLVCMPFTMVSQHKTSEVNSYINSFPKGFPNAIAMNKVENKFEDKTLLSVYGYENFYTKNISIQDHIISPTVNRDYLGILPDSVLRETRSRHPFFYTSTNDSIELIEFSGNHFSFATTTNHASEFHLTQQYNHNWQAVVNKNKVAIEKDDKAFMKIILPVGKNSVELIYRPKWIIYSAILSLMVLITCTGLMTYLRFRQQYNSKYYL